MSFNGGMPPGGRSPYDYRRMTPRDYDPLPPTGYAPSGYDPYQRPPGPPPPQPPGPPQGPVPYGYSRRDYGPVDPYQYQYPPSMPPAFPPPPPPPPPAPIPPLPPLPAAMPGMDSGYAAVARRTVDYYASPSPGNGATQPPANQQPTRQVQVVYYDPNTYSPGAVTPLPPPPPPSQPAPFEMGGNGGLVPGQLYRVVAIEHNP